MTTSNSKRPSRPLVVLFGLPRHLYRHGWGWVLGHRFLQLTHTGRSSGRTYQTILEVIHYDPDSQEATIMSGFGPGADWLRNVQANGRAEVSIGRSSFTATHRMVRVEEAMRSSRPTNDGTVSSARLCAWSSAAYLVGAMTVRTRRAARPLSNCRRLRSGRAHAPEAAITEPRSRGQATSPGRRALGVLLWRGDYHDRAVGM